jgi:serine O-acetyltransferase
MICQIRQDLERYRGESDVVAVALNPAVWALVWFRFGSWLYRESTPRLWRWILGIPYRLVYAFIEVFLGMHLDPSATIGPGLYIGHAGGIHINPEAVIGANCNLTHHTTIGTSAMGRQGAPVIGNNVYIGTGATIIGKIVIGDGVRVAANTLVISNIPDGATVMGVPGRIVMRAAVSRSKG